MSILNVAVIGAGGRAGAHFPIIRKLNDKYRLIAVCDIDEEKAKSIASNMGGKAYTSFEEMLSKEKPDVCLIATQAESHHAIGRILAERKINIITETPIALTMPCADLMINIAKKNGVLLEVSENVRRWPHERLKRLIVEKGIIGKVKEFYLSYTSGSYHGISGIRAILGSEAVSVSGEFPNDENIREVGYIEWSDGITGKYEYNKARGNYWEIIGTEGAIRGRELHLYNGNKKLNIITDISGEGDNKTLKKCYVETEPQIVWESPYQNYPLPGPDEVSVAEVWCSIYEGIINGKKLDYGGENGKKDMELLIAIRESATKKGEKVSLPLKGITEIEKLIHSEFEKVYGVYMPDMSIEHLKQKYTLPGALREIMYYGKVLAS